jgi:hypothetical protein
VTVYGDHRRPSVRTGRGHPIDEPTEGGRPPTEVHQILTRWFGSSHSASDSVTPKAS